MIGIFAVLQNYLELDVFLGYESWKHIRERHPEIDLEIIGRTLRQPDYVLMSEINPSSEIYFLTKNTSGSKVRFSVVIVKTKEDGLWISTAMTKNKISGGVEIYRRGQC